MNISELVPQPVHSETFRRNRLRYVPNTSGCYVLTTFSKVVLYIGLTCNLRRRMNEHLDSPQKTCNLELGRTVLFFWIECKQLDLNTIERTWLNIHIQHEGKYPNLNKMFSPTSV